MKRNWVICCILALVAAVHGLEAQDVVINEFLAINSGGITDEDGDTSDWAEIHNEGLTTVNLDGWYLTDDAGVPDKWRFPAVEVPSGGFLVVFCSGKDRAVAGSELHASLRLSSVGEYLALVRPDGSIAHHYAPQYPQQLENFSYGIGQAEQTTALVSTGAQARVRVPADAGDGLEWTQPDYDDTVLWTAGTTGIGYTALDDDVPPVGDPNLTQRPGVSVSQSSEYGEGLFPAELAIDRNFTNFSHTRTGEGPAWWQLDLGAEYGIGTIVLHNRGGGNVGGSRLRDITVRILDEGNDVVFESELLNSENELGSGTNGPPVLELDLRAAAVVGRIITIERTPDPDLSGTGGQGNADESEVLSLAEVEVFEPEENALTFHVATDIEDLMFDISSSAYVRIPFEIEDLTQISAFDKLVLKMTADDGFVAYVNGVELARRNAPASPAWNSAATSDALLSEEIDISDHRDAFQIGSNVLAVHGLNVSRDDEDFLVLPELVGLTTVDRAEQFFRNPTPAEANDDSGIIGFVADTQFSHDRGFYENAFEVEITTETPGAQIFYTLDGTLPKPTTGTFYTDPISIDTTTVLRAAAFKAGLESTNVDTQTYIFLDDVIAADVMDRAITQNPTYSPQMRDALTDLPIISLVTQGTINNTREVKTSVELILPDGQGFSGGGGFQEDAGVKYFGGNHTDFAKKNFRLYFRARHGARKLRYPVFAGHDRSIPAVEVFDQLELRSGSHDMVLRGFYMSNRFTDDTMLDMGNLNPHGQFVHLYLDGTYWGQYHLRERWNADMLAGYLGGEREEYESIAGNLSPSGGGWPDPGTPYDGDGSAWARVKSLRSDYEAVRPFLDAQHYVDFMLMFFFGESEAEFRCVGPMDAGSGFKFILNDADGFTRSGGNRTGGLSGHGPVGIFSSLFAEGHPDYKTLLGDRIHKHFFNDGVLTPTRNTARLLERCNQVERSFIAEAARWGYRTPASWESAKNAYVDGILPRRTATVIEQFRSARFYPTTEAPVFSQHGGMIPGRLGLTIDSPTGTTYYTLDGTDPRLPGGGVSPNAFIAGEVENATVVLGPGAEVRVLVPQDGSLGLDWTDPDFDDSDWLQGQTGVGFERASGYEQLIATDVEALMYQKNPGVYLRLPFTVDDPAELAFLVLRMKFDDGFEAYLNGERVASENAPDPLAWNSRSTQSHNDLLAMEFQHFDLASQLALLRPGRNLLAIHGLNSSANGGDMLIVPQIEVSDQSSGLVLERTNRVRARARDQSNGEWSAMNEATFAADSSGLRITELMYNPPPPEGESPHSRGDFEYLEFQNVGERPLNLMSIRLAGGVDFTFPERPVEEDLQPGEFVVVVRSLEAFASRYDTDGLYVAGEYQGGLDNRGEPVVLGDILRNTLLDFVYSDDWYPLTDGAGHSLEIVDPSAAPETWGDQASWRASQVFGGTPGAGEGPGSNGGLQLPSDMSQDGVVNITDAVALLGYLFRGSPATAPCGDGDLEETPNQRLLDATGDGRVNLADPVRVLRFLFSGESPPVLGTECTRINGCPDVCAE